MNVIMMGPQGSGKGIQSEILAKKIKLKHLSIGDLLREMAKSNTLVGKILRAHMDKGELIPDEINDKLLRELLTKHKDNYVLDGYPRNLHQAGYLLRLTRPDIVIIINISQKESINRISKRRVCTASHKTFIVDQITKKDRDECKKAGGKIVKREDDIQKAIKERLKLYHNDTIPAIDFLKRKKIRIVKINGERSIETVNNDILRRIKSLKSS